MTHRQVVLSELGFSVDQGLEDIIRACWHRGIATVASCIGGVYRDDAEILFRDMDDGCRWEDVTGRDCYWNEDCPETRAAAFFPAADIPALVEVLGTIDPVDLEEYRAAVQQYNTRRAEKKQALALDPFTREVRRQRLEREASR